MAAYCEAYATYADVSNTRELEGMLMEGANGNRRAHPLVSVQQKAILKLSKEFGLSPMSRGSNSQGLGVAFAGDDLETLHR